MSPLQHVIDSLQTLDTEEKVFVRNLLNGEIANQTSEAPNSKAKPLIGLLADEPQLADEICESAMQARESRPHRVNSV